MLTRFVANTEDLSDESGYKFRFHCDKCKNGFESQYVSGSANLLKTAIDAFQMFRPLGGWGGEVARDVDRGLRGKEHDQAYERAVHEVQSFFKQCTACNKWVCPNACWNASAGLCTECAPNATDVRVKEAARMRAERAAFEARRGVTAGPGATLSCPVCACATHGEKFCANCGTSLAAKPGCRKCGRALALGTKFCGECGEKVG